MSEKQAFADEIGVPIETEYEVVRTNGDISLLRVHLITGKTHQIRIHLASIGHPIIGDRKYGDSKINKQYQKDYGIHYQMLHAKELHFPDDFPLEKLAGRVIEAPAPKAFKTIFERTGLR